MKTKFGKLGEEETTHCTVGFIAESDYGPVDYALTAGHCIADSQGEPGGGVGGQWFSGFGAIGSALGYVVGSQHDLPPAGEGTTTDEGDEGLLYINPEGEYGRIYEPWVVVYGNSGFGTTRDEHYPIRGVHNGLKRDGPQDFMVCIGGAPTRTAKESAELEGEPAGEPTEGKPRQAERCGVTRGFHNGPTSGVKHLVELWQCDPSNKEGLGDGASGSPVYKNGIAYGIYTSSSTENASCEGFYENITTIEDVFHVHVIRAG